MCPVSLNAATDHEMSEANLGETLRRLRGAAQLSLRSLAEKTGFSASFLSQVENGQASPSIASMERIAAALGATMGQIFDRPEPSDALRAVVRADGRVALTSEWSNARIESLGAASPRGRLDPVLLTLAPGGTSGKRPYSSESEEFAFVLEGTVVLTLEEQGRGTHDPARQHVLQSGDAVTIRAGIARRWQNLSQAPVLILMVSARLAR
jgi:XRE family transcriptional regulator, regulator of sulfur utilization